MRRYFREEQMIQRTVVEHLKTRAVPGLLWFHPPNGGARSPIEAKIFKSLGVRAGVADLILLHEHQFYALELKTLDGELAPAQIGFLESVRCAGGIAEHAKGLDEAIWLLETWGLLRGRAV